MSQEEQIFPGRIAGKLENIVYEMKREMPFVIEYHRQTAILIKAKYDAFVENGFTKEQALELCKAGIKI